MINDELNNLPENQDTFLGEGVDSNALPKSYFGYSDVLETLSKLGNEEEEQKKKKAVATPSEVKPQATVPVPAPKTFDFKTPTLNNAFDVDISNSEYKLDVKGASEEAKRNDLNTPIKVDRKLTNGQVLLAGTTAKDLQDIKKPYRAPRIFSFNTSADQNKPNVRNFVMKANESQDDFINRITPEIQNFQGQEGQNIVNKFKEQSDPTKYKGLTSTFIPNFGVRQDGTKKGTGWLGVLVNSKGESVTEYTVGVPIDGVETDIPSLVPTLTQEEIQVVLKSSADGSPLPQSIVNKARNFAIEQKRKGESYFAPDNKPKPEDRLKNVATVFGAISGGLTKFVTGTIRGSLGLFAEAMPTPISVMRKERDESGNMVISGSQTKTYKAIEEKLQKFEDILTKKVEGFFGITEQDKQNTNYNVGSGLGTAAGFLASMLLSGGSALAGRTMAAKTALDAARIEGSFATAARLNTTSTVLREAGFSKYAIEKALKVAKDSFRLNTNSIIEAAQKAQFYQITAVGSVLIGAPLAQAEARDRINLAKKKGLTVTPTQELISALSTIPISYIEQFSAGKVLKPFMSPAFSEIGKEISQKMGEKLFTKVMVTALDILKTGGTEGLEEYLQSIGANLVENQYKSIPITQGANDAARIGFLVGGLMQGVGSIVSRVDNYGKKLEMSDNLKKLEDELKKLDIDTPYPESRSFSFNTGNGIETFEMNPNEKKEDFFARIILEKDKGSAAANLLPTSGVSTDSTPPTASPTETPITQPEATNAMAQTSEGLVVSPATGAISTQGTPASSPIVDDDGQIGQLQEPPTALAGVPVIKGATGPDPFIVPIVDNYAKENNIPYERQKEYVDVDEGRAKRIAQAYEEMKHDPNNPKVKEAYASLIEQTKKQYEALTKAGYKFDFFDSQTDPYEGNPYSAIRDMRGNKKMSVYGTYDGFGEKPLTEEEIANNPMLADTGLEWPDQGGVMHKVTANDLFRAVHDAFGHGIEGAGFRARGEENAWQAHARMFTGPAIGAMTTETRGQNSWLNFGPKGEANRTAKLQDTTFAEQKTGLMPEWTWKEGFSGAPKENKPEGPVFSSNRPLNLKAKEQARESQTQKEQEQVIRQSLYKSFSNPKFGLKTTSGYFASGSNVNKGVQRLKFSNSEEAQKRNVLVMKEFSKEALEAGAISPKGKKMFDFLIDNIDPKTLEDVTLELLSANPKLSSEFSSGEWSPIENIVKIMAGTNVFTNVSSDYGTHYDELASHEFIHYLQQFLPEEVRTNLIKQYINAASRKLQTLDRIFKSTDNVDDDVKNYFILEARAIIENGLTSIFVKGKSLNNAVAGKTLDRFWKLVETATEMHDEGAIPLSVLSEISQLYKYTNADEFVAESMPNYILSAMQETQPSKKSYTKPLSFLPKNKSRIQKIKILKSVLAQAKAVHLLDSHFKSALNALKNKDGKLNFQSMPSIRSLHAFASSIAEQLIPSLPDAAKKAYEQAKLVNNMPSDESGELPFKSNTPIDKNPKGKIDYSDNAYLQFYESATTPSGKIFKEVAERVNRFNLLRVGPNESKAVTFVEKKADGSSEIKLTPYGNDILNEISTVLYLHPKGSMQEQWSNNGFFTTRGNKTIGNPEEYIIHQISHASQEDSQTASQLPEGAMFEYSNASVPAEALQNKGDNINIQDKMSEYAESWEGFSENLKKDFDLQNKVFPTTFMKQESSSTRQLGISVALKFYMLDVISKKFSKSVSAEVVFGDLLKELDSTKNGMERLKLALNIVASEYEAMGIPITKEEMYNNPLIANWIKNPEAFKNNFMYKFIIPKSNMFTGVAKAWQLQAVEDSVLDERYYPEEKNTSGSSLALRKGEISIITARQTFYKSKEFKDIKKKYLEQKKEIYRRFGFQYPEAEEFNTIKTLENPKLNPAERWSLDFLDKLSLQEKTNFPTLSSVRTAAIKEISAINRAEKQEINTNVNNIIESKKTNAKGEVRFQKGGIRFQKRPLIKKPIIIEGERSLPSFESLTKQSSLESLPTYIAPHLAGISMALYTINSQLGIGTPQAISNAAAVWLGTTFVSSTLKNIIMKIKGQRIDSKFDSKIYSTTSSRNLSSGDIFKAYSDLARQQFNTKNPARALLNIFKSMVDPRFGNISQQAIFDIAQEDVFARQMAAQAEKSANLINKELKNINKSDPTLAARLQEAMYNYLEPAHGLKGLYQNLLSKSDEYQKILLEIQENFKSSGTVSPELTQKANDSYEQLLKTQKDFQTKSLELKKYSLAILKQNFPNHVVENIDFLSRTTAEIQQKMINSNMLTDKQRTEIEIQSLGHVNKTYLAFADKTTWASQFEERIEIFKQTTNKLFDDGKITEKQKDETLKLIQNYKDNPSSVFENYDPNEPLHKQIKKLFKSLPQGSVKTRKFIDDAMEEFLGVVDNPLMGKLIGIRQDTRTVRDNEVSRIIVEAAVKAGNAIKKTSPDSEEMPPDGFLSLSDHAGKNEYLRDYFFKISMIPLLQKELINGSKTHFVINEIYELLSFLRAGKTLVNFSLYMSQIPSNFILMSAQGDLFNRNILPILSAWAKGASIPIKDVFGIENLGAQIKASSEVNLGETPEGLLRLSYELGHLTSGNSSQELLDVFENTDSPRTLSWWIEKFGTAFSVSDTAMRHAAFVSRYFSIKAEHVNRVKDGKGQMPSMEQIAKEATREILALYPMTALVPSNVKKLANISIVQQFVSYVYGINRGLANSVKMNTQKIMGEDPYVKARAATELSSLIAVLSLLAYGIGTFDSGDDDKKEEKNKEYFSSTNIDSIKSIDTSSFVNQQGILFKWINKELGTYSFFKTGQIQPYQQQLDVASALFKMSTNAKNLNSNEFREGKELFIKSFYDVFTANPTESMVYLNIYESLTGETIRDGKSVRIRGEFAGMNALQRIFYHAGSNAMPVEGKNILNFYKLTQGDVSTEDEMQRFLSRYAGAAQASGDINKDLKSSVRRFNKNLEDLRNKVIKDSAGSTLITSSFENLKDLDEKRQKLFSNMKRTMSLAEELGMPRNKIIRNLEDSGLSREQISDILSGGQTLFSVNDSASVVNSALIDIANNSTTEKQNGVINFVVNGRKTPDFINLEKVFLTEYESITGKTISGRGLYKAYIAANFLNKSLSLTVKENDRTSLEVNKGITGLNEGIIAAYSNYMPTSDFSTLISERRNAVERINDYVETIYNNKLTIEEQYKLLIGQEKPTKETTVKVPDTVNVLGLKVNPIITEFIRVAKANTKKGAVKIEINGKKYEF